jgi:hypothetical protein
VIPVDPVAIPILPSADFDATAGFYAPLGFAERGRWPGEYLILRRTDGTELHFWSKKDLDPARNDAGCYIRFAAAEGARALHESWAAVDPRPRLHPPRETDYGLLEFALIDPHGNLLRVGGALPSRAGE